MNTRTIAGLSAAALAAGLGFGATQLASADDTTPTPTTSASAPATDADASQRDGHSGRGRGADGGDLTGLADELGVSEDELSEAMAAAREALEDGTYADRAARTAALAEALAGELGIESETVQDALDQLEAERKAERAADEAELLDQAVTDGTLTEDEAAAVQKALDAGIVSARGGGRH